MPDRTVGFVVYRVMVKQAQTLRKRKTHLHSESHDCGVRRCDMEEKAEKGHEQDLDNLRAITCAGC